MVRILAHCTCGQPLLFMLRMTLTITITMTGLEAVRILNERETRKHPNAGLQRIDHKKRTSLPIQYDFPYRYVFPANHPYSSYAQFLGLPAAATPHYNNGGGGGSPSYDLYAPIPPAPPFAASLYQHQHMHQHQHQLQLQQPLSQPQPPQPPPPPLPPQNAQPEFKYTLKPGSSSNSHHPQHAASSHNGHMGPFQSGSASPTVLLLHATNPAAGSVQTFLLIPASTNDGGQSFSTGPSVPPNFMNAAGVFPLRSLSGAGGSGTLPGAAQMSMPGSSATAHSAAPIPSPMMMMHPADHTKIANSHFLNQLSAAQLMSRPINGGGVYQLPMMPTNGKYYKRKKSSIEAKMSQADGGHATLQSSGDRQSTSTESATSEIRNGHAPRIPADQDDTSSDTFEDYMPANGGPLSTSKRS